MIAIEREPPGTQPFARSKWAAQGRHPFPGSGGNVFGAPQIGHPRRTHLYIEFDLALNEWLCDRAAILGVKKTHLIRDVLALYARLVSESEAAAGIDYGVTYSEIILNDREPGYLSALTPHGHLATHLDDTPLGVEELP